MDRSLEGTEVIDHDTDEGPPRRSVSNKPGRGVWFVRAPACRPRRTREIARSYFLASFFLPKTQWSSQAISHSSLAFRLTFLPSP